MRLFSPRKTTLLFVIRDKTKVYNTWSFPDATNIKPLMSIYLTAIGP